MSVIVRIVEDGYRLQPRPPQPLLREAHRPPDPRRDLPHRVSLDHLHPEDLPLQRRQHAQRFAYRDTSHVHRLGDLFHDLLPRDHSTVLAQIVAAGVTDRTEKPLPLIPDRRRRLEVGQEHLVDQPFRFVDRDTELLHGVTPEMGGQRFVQLFKRHCCTESHDSPSFLTSHGTPRGL